MDFIKKLPLIIKNKLLKGDGLAKNSAVLFLGVMVASVLNYIFHLVIGRMVSVEEYGKIETLISLINIILIPSTALLMMVAQQNAGFKAQNDKLSSRYLLKHISKKTFLTGLPVLLFFIFLTPYLNKFLKIGENLPLMFVWLIMFFSFLSVINTGTLRGWQKFKSASALNVWGALIKLIAGIILVKFGFAISGAIGSIALSAVFSYIISWLMLKFILKQEEKPVADLKPNCHFSEMKKAIIPFFIGNLAINILGNIDMTLASRNLDSLTAGQYGALTVASKIIFFFTGVIAVALFSMSSENHQKKSDTWAIFKKALFLMLSVSLGAIIFYFIFPNFVLKLMFGSKYTDVSQYLGWFAIMVTLFSLVNLIFQYLLSIKKIRAVYGFLGVAILSTFLVFLFGKNICVILKIMTFSQLAAVVIGVYFLFKNTEKKIKQPL